MTYGTPEFKPVDIASLSDDQLVKLQLHRNDWQVRHARRVLQERSSLGKNMTQAKQDLLAIFQDQADVPIKLRALWALRAIGGLDDDFLLRQLGHDNEYVRAWSIRFLCESSSPTAIALARFVEMSKKDSSPVVRLYLASAVQRLPSADRWQVAAALLQHGEDATDINLPLMNWYTVESLIDVDLQRFIDLAKTARIPLVRNHIARRVASHKESASGLETLSQLLSTSDDSAFQLDLLTGMLRGLEGRRSVAMPVNWTAAFAKMEHSDSPNVKQSMTELGLVFGDPRALATLRKIAVDRSAIAQDRQRAVRSLVAKREGDVASLLIDLLSDPAVNRDSIRGLAEFDHPKTSRVLIDSYSAMDNGARQDALQTLASRATWGTSLIEAVESNRIPRKDLTAFTARQLHSLGDKKLSDRIVQTWGEMRTTSADKTQLIAKYKKLLNPATIKKADLSAGRALFQKNCANCHRMFGEGGTIGPEITGAQRMNIDYMLENLIDPSAAVAKDFQMELVQTDAGRVVTGLVVDESDNALTVQTANERLVLPKVEIENRSLSKLSMMPDGLLQTFTNDQVRDIIGYLASPNQVELPVERK